MGVAQHATFGRRRSAPLCRWLIGSLAPSRSGITMVSKRRTTSSSYFAMSQRASKKKASRCGATDVARRAGSAHGIRLQRGGISCRVSTCSIFYSVRCSEVQINETVGGRMEWAVSESVSSSRTAVGGRRTGVGCVCVVVSDCCWRPHGVGCVCVVVSDCCWRPHGVGCVCVVVSD
jgi:hypothetical protein